MTHETRVIRSGESQWTSALHRDGTTSEVCVNVTGDDQMTVQVYPAPGHQPQIRTDQG